MHVVFLTNEYPPLPSGGIGTSIRNLARALVAGGHRATVIGMGAGAEFEDQGVAVRFVAETRAPKVGWLWDIRRMERELNALVRCEHADIVEAHDWGGVAVGLRPRCPLLIRCNGSDTYFAHLLHKKVRPSVRWAEMLALKGADDVIAVSRFTANVTRRLFRLRREIGVIHNGIDAARFSPAQASDTEPNTILYFGSLLRKKGVIDLCRIFSSVVAKHPAARLLLVGRDSKDHQTGVPSTWTLCRELLSPATLAQVEYLGVKPYDEVQEFVRRATLCVFPSYAEAFPLSWLEAMACAKPVVAYDIGWASEVIEPGTSGVLVPASDREALATAICRLLSAPDERRRLGAAARERVATHFTSEVIARKSIKRYECVLGR